MAASPPQPRAPIASPSEPAGGGFAIRLPSAQLADLIQINCLNRVRGVFRVCSGLEDGHLYFEDGQLVHADFGDATGLDAVVQMLALRGGSIEPCEREWPEQSSIGMGADALLLHAAQRLDEGSAAAPADATTKVVRRVPHPEQLGQELTRREVEEPALSLPPRPESEAPPSACLERLMVAKVGQDGGIQKLMAGASSDLADTGFFCQRLAGLVGEALGLGTCAALALEAETEGIVVFQGRSIVAARGTLPDLQFVLRKVGLG